ncbi:reverse transcriptase-like protein [Bacillus massilinigeriensis]|uniref:reverse transcriptase-like protein n=1 Tax=Bacillus mediterraneensis TaxID=1805474 RepID=UPI0008F929AC|nr:reverse transcriptase-like protein [Bacillus mediterraneensis]
MIEVYFDGASAGNPGPSGAGIFIVDNGEVHRYSIPLKEMTNHEAEFHAFIIALEICHQNGYRTVSLRTDSDLVNKAVEKEYVKNKLFSPLLESALCLTEKFDLFFLKWVPSSMNKSADELARRAIDRSEPGRQ